MQYPMIFYSDLMPALAKQIVHSCMQLQESLCVIGRLESSHLSFSATSSLMRVHRPIIR